MNGEWTQDERFVVVTVGCMKMAASGPSKLNNAEWRVIEVISLHHVPNHPCNPSHKKIRGLTGLDRKTVISAEKRLEEKYWLRVGRESGRRNQYYLLADEKGRLLGPFAMAWPNTCGDYGTSPNNATGGENGTGASPKNTTPPVPKTPQASEKEKEIGKEKKNHTPPLPPKGGRRQKKGINELLYPDLFEELWKLYPRHIGKHATIRQWNFRLLEAEDAEAEACALISAARHYAQRCQALKTPKEKTKFPSTFIGRDRWYEDYVAGIPADEQQEIREKANGWGQPLFNEDGERRPKDYRKPESRRR